MVPLAATYRNGRVEALHYGAIAVVDANGALLYGLNDPHMGTYLRSSIKMFQAMPVLLSGAAERFGFTEAELSLCCASHSGAHYHLETAATMLRKIGLDESALACGAHDPDDRPERERLLQAGEHPSQLHNNCSGKHAGMLAVCLAMNWPIENYLDLGHPLQQWNLDIIAEYTGIPAREIGTAIDGCSLPTFYTPVSAAARAMSRFTAETDAGEEPASRISRAISARPEMIHEEGSFDTELIRTLAGRGLTKRGAMAIQTLGIRTERYGPVGLAVKLSDGSMGPMPAVVMRLLDGLGVLTSEESAALNRFRSIVVKNWRGIEVGAVLPEFEPALESLV